MMGKARGLLNHLTVIFGIMFLVFLVLDQFNTACIAFGEDPDRL